MLKELIAKFCCLHDWEEKKDIAVYSYDFGKKSEFPVSRKYLYLCKKCGEFKWVQS